jgi:AcrR family transcriptional regulator
LQRNYVGCQSRLDQAASLNNSRLGLPPDAGPIEVHSPPEGVLPVLEHQGGQLETVSVVEWADLPDGAARQGTDADRTSWRSLLLRLSWCASVETASLLIEAVDLGEVRAYASFVLPTERTGQMAMRERILEATANLIKPDGISAVTTKKIAAEAGCAEGSIFRHFGDKGGLLAAVLSFGLPETHALMEAVDVAKSSCDLRAGLRSVAEALLAFYRASCPLVASALADRELFARYSSAHREGGTGPQQAWQLVHDFLVAQRDAGRVGAEVDLQVHALCVTGACQNAVWVEMVSGPDTLPHGGDAISGWIVAALVPGLTRGLGRGAGDV